MTKTMRLWVSLAIISIVSIFLAILYSIETNKTISGYELISDLLIVDIDNVNSETSIESLKELQDFIRSEDFTHSNMILEVKGKDKTFIVQYGQGKNREIVILNIEEIEH